MRDYKFKVGDSVKVKYSGDPVGYLMPRSNYQDEVGQVLEVTVCESVTKNNVYKLLFNDDNTRHYDEDWLEKYNETK